MILGNQERPKECISDLKFDAWFAGELTDEMLCTAQAHLALCERCQKRQAELRQAREDFFAMRSRVNLPWRKSSAIRRPWSLRIALAAATFSAAFVIALFARPRESNVEQSVRLKGSAHIGFFIQRSGAFERATPTYVVRPNDRIRFVYTSARPAYLAIYGLDARGTVSVYFPQGDLAERVVAGSDVALKSAVELDDVLGPERVFGLFCEAEFRVSDIRKWLKSKHTLESPPGCHVDMLTWNKEHSP